MICFDGVSFFKTASPSGVPQSNSFFQDRKSARRLAKQFFFKTASPLGVPQSNSFFQDRKSARRPAGFAIRR